jgi:8-hydroxy-5-deazaflavin:NADPH oxidoreductase
MKIGVIGIGKMGGTIARRWSEKGHGVRVANSRGPQEVEKFADEIGADPADIYGAVEGADVVLLSMPFPAVSKLPNDLFNQAAEDVAIIDTANYFPDLRDPHIAEIDAGMPESVWTSQQLGRPIFKAFNSIMFYSLSELGKPAGSPDRLAIPVAGDNARAKQIVMGLVNDTGFDPVDGEDARRDQGCGQGQGGDDSRQRVEGEI